jgi:hypothetical protein
MRILSFLGVVALLVGQAQAGPVLWVNDDVGVLGKVDVATGNVTIVGNSGVVLTDIGFDTAGNLFGVSFNRFYSVDKTSGLATSIGLLGNNDMNALVFSSTGTAYAMGNSSDVVYTVDVGTGAATNSGNAGGFASGGDLAFHGGNLYLASTSNDLVDVALGTAVGPFGVSSVFGLANGDDNVLYAVAGTKVYSVDVVTGAATYILDYSGKGLGNANGQAFYAEAGAVVPEPGAYLMLAIGMAASWPVIRRSRAA